MRIILDGSCRKTFYINLIYILIASIFGNDFIQNGSFYLLAICNSLVAIYCIFRNPSIFVNPSNMSKSWSRCVLAFLILIIVYIIGSYFDVFRLLFGLNDLGYRRTYILRHAYLIFMVPFIYVNLRAVKQTDVFTKLFYNTKLLVVVWLFMVAIRMMGLYDFAILRPLSFAIVVALVLNNKNNLTYWIIFVIDLFTTNQPDSSTSWLAVVVAIVVWVAHPLFEKIWLRLGTLQTVFIVGCVLLFLSFGTNMIEYYISDANSLWRWQYWRNEFKVLIKSCFVGVGYGTAYASNSIYNEINNASVFSSSSSIIGGGLYIITQHNSFMNFLYRLGIVGFFLAVQSIVIYPISWFYSLIDMVDEHKMKVLVWGIVNMVYNLVVITVNPGLESPRFGIVPCFVFSIFIGSLLRNDEERYTDLSIE